MATATRPTKKNRRVTPAHAPLLDTRAPLAFQRIAQTFLGDLKRARRQLDAESDDAALHDFRVALRRLRSTLKVYRPVVKQGPAPRKLRRRLKRLARATGAARDAEVGLMWLRENRKGMNDAERAVCNQLIQDWTARRDAAYKEVRRTLKKKFRGLDARLNKTLRATGSASAGPALAQSAGKLLSPRVGTLAKKLDGIACVFDTQPIHAARIEAKRLRYLLEPLQAELPNGAVLVKSLKRFQTDVGELCDRQVLSEELIAVTGRYETKGMTGEVRALLGYPATEPSGNPDPRAGLLALAGRLRTEREQRFVDIERRYLGEHTEAFLEPFRTLVDNVRQASATRPAAALAEHERQLSGAP